MKFTKNLKITAALAFTLALSGQSLANSSQIKKTNFGGIGIQIVETNGEYLVHRVIDGSPAQLAGVKAGDVIDEIGFESTDMLSMKDVINSIRGEVGTEIEIDFLRNSEEIGLSIVRTDIELTLSSSKNLDIENLKDRSILNKPELTRHLEAQNLAEIFVDDKLLEKDYIDKPSKESFRIFSVEMNQVKSANEFINIVPNGKKRGVQVDLPELGAYEFSIYSLKGERLFSSQDLAWQKQVLLDLPKLNGSHLIKIKQGQFETSYTHSF
jgi:membrane-associated protease RseP (regulator of RpoE activity)